MGKPEFVHLHFHTQYSILDGACRVKDAVKKAQELEMPALAISDHGVMYGVIEFYKTCKAAGIKPIIGCEAYTTTGNMREKNKLVDGSVSNHLLLLAKNQTGYQNLAKMASLAQLEGFHYVPRIDFECLSEHAQGLVATTTCFKGEIPQLILKDDLEGAVRRAGEYAELFDKGDYYVELQDHGIPDQKRINKGLFEVAKRLNLPLVATNDVHYIEQPHWEAHDVLLCIRTGRSKSDPNRMRYSTREFYMKSAEEMQRLFPDHPEALRNTLEIAEKCNVEIHLSSGKAEDLHFPVFAPPNQLSQKEFLTQLAAEGIREKYQIGDVFAPQDKHEQEVLARLNHEIAVIEETGFINYFLVVWDFINHAHKVNIPVGPGRGSGAGSLVAYALGITNIDPLKYNLIFERFLNPKRISPPDFDIDFCMYRRGEVIEYVKEKYGHENCAQIITFGTMGAKMVIRDVARALDVPLAKADAMAKLIPDGPGWTLEKAVNQSPDFRQLTDTDPDAMEIMKFARVLEGLPRNAGTHAAGVVIGEKPLMDLIPLARDKDQQPVTQFEMKPLEETGLLKMDFLGLKTLTVISEAVHYIQKNHGIEINPDALPLDDPKTFELLNRGDTTGVFQLESSGMKKMLRDFQLKRFEDIVFVIAIYRPGPMGEIPKVLKRRHGQAKVSYDHPLLEDILNETFGVMIYQEQVQQAAAVLAGYDMAQGDLLRRAMGKKNKEVMEKERAHFIKGCKSVNHIPEKQAKQIFDNIEKFAGYGFNKSHSVAYGMIGYQTAYLKAHYPEEFMAALCSCEMENPDKLAFFIEESQKMGIQVLPPSVNGGGARFIPEKKAIRFGLTGVKGVGKDVVEALVKEREANGPYKSMTDFCIRLEGKYTNKRVLESLVRSGAFDFTGRWRSQLFAGIESIIKIANTIRKDRDLGQTLLFDELGGESDGEDANDELPDVPIWTNQEMLQHEKDLIGFYISGHPLDEYKWLIRTYQQTDLSEFHTLEKGTMTRVAGLVSAYRKHFTKSGDAMCFFDLEGLNGTKINVVMFARSYKTFEQVFKPKIITDPETGEATEDKKGLVLLLQGKVGDEENKLLADTAYLLDRVPEQFTRNLSLTILAEKHTLETITTLKEVLRAHPGITPVRLHYTHHTGYTITIECDDVYYVAPNEALHRELGELLGEEHINYTIPDERPRAQGNYKKRASRTA